MSKKDTQNTLFERIASGGPETVNPAIVMLAEYGYPEPTNRQQLADALTNVAADFGETALRRMASFHPDREFIVANATDISPGLQTYSLVNGNLVPVGYKNDCGCHKNDVGAAVAPPLPSAAANTNGDASGSNAKMDSLLFAVLVVMVPFVVIGGTVALVMIVSGSLKPKN